MPAITVRGTFAFQFHNFHNWVNRAKEYYSKIPKGVDHICIDKNGFNMQIGEDFMYARDNDLFPATVYTLTRTINHKDDEES